MLEVFFSKNDLLTVREAKNLGISRYKLFNLVKKGYLERLKNGIYKKRETLNDEFAAISVKNENVVFSYHTALFLYDLSDRVPNIFHISVPQGYNVRHIKKHTNSISVHYIKRENFELGISEIKTPYGNKVKIYDLERTICDIVSQRRNIDRQIYVDALKGYFKRNDKNLRKLIKYSVILGVEEEIRKYIEIL